MSARLHLLLAHGPNLARLGKREPELYGTATLVEIEARVQDLGGELGADVVSWQGNGEGALIDRLEGGVGSIDACVLNPGAYAHTSLALRDCIAALPYPVVEIHLTNPLAREAVRHTFVLAGVVAGMVAGFGVQGYDLAVRAAVDLAQRGRGKKLQ